MPLQKNSVKFEEVSLDLPIYYMNKPAFSAPMFDIYKLMGFLVRSSAILSLLYYNNDSRLEHIHSYVRSKRILTNEIISDVLSLYPLEFISLTKESPLNLKILSIKEIAEAIEKIVRLPLTVNKDLIEIETKEIELQQLKEKNKALPISKKELAKDYDMPEYLIEGVNDAHSFHKVIELASELEDLRYKQAKTFYWNIKAIQELYKLPGYNEAPFRVSQIALSVYNTQLLRDMNMHQTSDYRIHKSSLDDQDDSDKHDVKMESLTLNGTEKKYYRKLKE